MVTDSENAYIAGYLDADGSICLFGEGNNVKLVVQISSTKYDSLLWIHSRYPGKIYTSISKNKKAVPSHCLTYSSRSGTDILKGIYPFLVLKKIQCGLALDFIDTISATHVGRAGIDTETKELREFYMDEMRYLNSKGAE